MRIMPNRQPYIFPQLFEPFKSNLYTRPVVFRSPVEARRAYMKFKLNLDFTNQADIFWYKA